MCVWNFWEAWDLRAEQGGFVLYFADISAIIFTRVRPV